MISQNIENALNKQIELEGYASFLYLSMASWCDKNGLPGSSRFMHRQSDEERMHMLKIYEYMADVDGFAITPGIPQPQSEWPSVKNMFEQVLEHEQKVTKSINYLMDQSIKENDHTTQNFLQWYVQEQREEESLMRYIIDRINLIGDGPQSLFYIDKEIEEINIKTSKSESA
jgi:ferritin